MRKSFLILVCALATSLCAADFSGKSSDELIKSLNTKDPVVFADAMFELRKRVGEQNKIIFKMRSAMCEQMSSKTPEEHFKFKGEVHKAMSDKIEKLSPGEKAEFFENMGFSKNMKNNKNCGCNFDMMNDMINNCARANDCRKMPKFK